MTTQQIASRLTELCRKGEFVQAQKELYAENAVSIEPFETPEFEKVTQGLGRLFEKGKKFTNMVETIHAVDISDPLVAGNAIAFTMTMDVTMKGKNRSSFDQICLYQVKDGKIVSEQFYV